MCEEYMGYPVYPPSEEEDDVVVHNPLCYQLRVWTDDGLDEMLDEGVSIEDASFYLENYAHQHSCFIKPLWVNTSLHGTPIIYYPVKQSVYYITKVF